MASRSAQSSLMGKSALKRPRTLDTDSDSSDDNKKRKKTKGLYKSKCLILCSRGVTYHMRHLMNDVADLVTHGKKDAKLDTKHTLSLVNELADLSSCNQALYFESRRRSDLYLWAAQCPNGPSIRFHVVNMHTMGEVRMTGNCLKGSRPVVVFGQEFDSSPTWKVCKQVLANIFAVPKSARRAKPFVDHVISLNIVDGKIWFRNYQIINKDDDDDDELMLSEIGPRFTLVPMKVFEGSFGGACVWENREFVAPVRALKEKQASQAARHAGRQEQQRERRVRREERAAGVVDDELSQRVVFA